MADHMLYILRSSERHYHQVEYFCEIYNLFVYQCKNHQKDCVLLMPAVPNNLPVRECKFQRLLQYICG